jgi:hypothetical protein
MMRLQNLVKNVAVLGVLPTMRNEKDIQLCVKFSMFLLYYISKTSSIPHTLYCKKCYDRVAILQISQRDLLFLRFDFFNFL